MGPKVHFFHKKNNFGLILFKFYLSFNHFIPGPKKCPQLPFGGTFAYFVIANVPHPNLRIVPIAINGFSET